MIQIYGKKREWAGVTNQIFSMQIFLWTQPFSQIPRIFTFNTINSSKFCPKNEYRKFLHKINFYHKNCETKNGKNIFSLFKGNLKTIKINFNGIFREYFMIIITVKHLYLQIFWERNLQMSFLLQLQVYRKSLKGRHIKAIETIFWGWKMNPPLSHFKFEMCYHLFYSVFWFGAFLAVLFDIKKFFDQIFKQWFWHFAND